MENASKALIIAGEVLIGVMILSVAVYVFQMFAGYSEERYKEIEDRQIAAFNSQFLTFYGLRTDDEGKQTPIKCTIHDIVSLANLAQRHNKEQQLEDNSGYSENTLYVQIDLNNMRNIEKYTNDQLIQLIKQNDLQQVLDRETGKYETQTKYYKCTACDININTGRVNYIHFQEMQ